MCKMFLPMEIFRKTPGSRRLVRVRLPLVAVGLYDQIAGQAITHQSLLGL